MPGMMTLPDFNALARCCRLWLVAALVLAAAWAAGPVRADQDHIVARAWFADPTGQLDFAAARAQVFTPYSGLLNLGYVDATVWLRLRIDPAAAGEQADAHAGQDDELVLRIRPAFLDEVTLFDPLYPGATPPVVGDRSAWSLNELHLLNPNFVVPRGEAPREVWLRLRTTGTSLIHVEAFSLADAHRIEHRLEMVNSLYIAVMAVLFLLGLVHWLTEHGRLLGIFVLRQFLALAYGFIILGQGIAFMPHGMPGGLQDWLGNLILVSMPAVALWFEYTLLKEFRPPAALHRWLLAPIFLYPVLVWLLLTGQTLFALNLNMFIIALMPLPMLALAVSARAWRDDGPRPAIPRSIVLTYYGLNLLILTLVSLPALGWVDAIEIALYAYLISSLLSALMMVVYLQFRFYRRERQRLQLATDLVIAQTQQAAAQRDSQAERARAARAEKAMVKLSENTLRQIGRDLHDDLGQILTGAAMLSDNLAFQLEQAGEAARPLAGSAEQIAGLLNQAVSKTRMLSHGLYPADLKEDSLIATLRQLAGEIQAASGIACRFTSNLEHLRLNPVQSLHLYRIAQEALQNAVRHSGASKIEINLSAERGRLFLDILDNGVGLPARAREAQSDTRHLGLTTIHQRANLIQAEARIANHASGGCQVSVNLALPADATVKPSDPSAVPPNSILPATP